jgi:hypothetical protein
MASLRRKLHFAVQFPLKVETKTKPKGKPNLRPDSNWTENSERQGKAEGDVAVWDGGAEDVESGERGNMIGSQATGMVRKGAGEGDDSVRAEFERLIARGKERGGLRRTNEPRIDG